MATSERLALALSGLDHNSIWSIAEAIGDTSQGLTGTQIDRLLERCRITTESGASSKAKRLAENLEIQTQRDGGTGCVLTFVQAVLDPVRFVDDPNALDRLRDRVNATLRFLGIEIDAAGQIVTTTPTATLSDAQARRKRMLSEMHRRGVHAQVLRYCSEELVANDCFAVVFEATKGLFDRIRELSGVELDGRPLIERVFSSGDPVLALNSLRTESEISEQKGMTNLLVGLYGAFRNPPAHAPRVRWHVPEADALDLLSTLSLVHRRLDAAVRVP